MTLSASHIMRSASWARDGTPRRSPTRRELEQRRDDLMRRLAALEMESLQLYRPIPRAALFHASTAAMRLADASNQSGKTFMCSVEFVRAITNTDPYKKYPPTGLAHMVPYDEIHAGDPIWKTMAEPGAFNLIPDEHTGVLRSVRLDPDGPVIDTSAPPDASIEVRLDPYDEAYREKWRPAPPLLPSRLIRETSWEKKNLRIPRRIVTTAGWTVNFRSSKSAPKRGDQINLFWFDEEIENTGHLPEAYRASMRHSGIGFWSATAQSGGDQYYELYSKAMAGVSGIERFPLYISENAFYTKAAKQQFYDEMSEQERSVRWYGIPEILGRFVYTEYSPMGMHGCEPFAIPPSWCVEVILDPASQRQGTLFTAVDPNEEHKYIWDGFATAKGAPKQWARDVKDRLQRRIPYRFIIDQQMGRSRSVGLDTGTTVAKEYFDALLEVGVESQQRGPLAGFYPGSKDVHGREAAVKTALAPRVGGPFDGKPELQIMRGKVPELDREIKLAQRSKSRPEKRVLLEEDLLVCAEYWLASHPRYHAPPVAEPVRVPDMRAAFLAEQASEMPAGRTTEITSALTIGR